MPAIDLMLPVFVQVLLIFCVLIQLGRTRARSLREANASRNDREKTGAPFEWSDAATRASNNLKNQFEMPVLFFAGVAFALIFRQTNFLLLALAWGFVISRIIHAIIHVGPNVIKWRASVYFLGVACLLAFWIALMVRILGGPAAAPL